MLARKKAQKEPHEVLAKGSSMDPLSVAKARMASGRFGCMSMRMVTAWHEDTAANPGGIAGASSRAGCRTSAQVQAQVRAERGAGAERASSRPWIAERWPEVVCGHRISN